jgi:hypothetical protein
VKTQGQIKQKIKQVVFRHRKRFVQEGLSRKPENCQHHKTVRLPLHTGNRAVIGVCGLEGKDLVCDSTMAGVAQAQDCKFFCCGRSAEFLKKDFDSRLGLNGEDIQIGAIAKDYPDLAALMWVMGASKNKVTKVQEDPVVLDILAVLGSEPEPDHIPERPLVEDRDAP